MQGYIAPVIGAWYRTSAGQRFEVIAIDETDQTVAIQSDDGTLAEYPAAHWRVLELDSIEPPPEWAEEPDQEAVDFMGDDWGFGDSAESWRDDTADVY